MNYAERATMPPTQQENPESIRRRMNALFDDDQKDLSKLMTRYEFVEFFNITPRTEFNWRKQGKMPFIKIGHLIYYSYADVSNLIQRFRNPNNI